MLMGRNGFTFLSCMHCIYIDALMVGYGVEVESFALKDAKVMYTPVSRIDGG